MKGRVLMLKLLPQLNLLQKKHVLKGNSHNAVNELVSKYLKAEKFTCDDVIADLLGLDVEYGKEDLFSSVLNNITTIGQQCQFEGGIPNE